MGVRVEPRGWVQGALEDLKARPLGAILNERLGYSLLGSDRFGLLAVHGDVRSMAQCAAIGASKFKCAEVPHRQAIVVPLR